MPFDWQGTRVRTVLRDGAPWFVAADVCEVLPALRTRGVYALPGAVRPGPDAAGAPHRLPAGLAAARRAGPVWRAHPLLAPDWVRAETLRKGIALVDYEDARALGLPARRAVAAAGVPASTLSHGRRAAAAGGAARADAEARGRPAFREIPEDVRGRTWAALNRGASISAAIRAGLAGAGPDAPSARTIRRRIRGVLALAQRAGGKLEPT